jgi:transcriptional regulator with XRE-family HTH domain
VTIYGELVRRYRIVAGLTQEELATLSGLDVRTISDIERGRTTRARRSTADLIARALGRDDLAYEAVKARRLGHAQRSDDRSVTPEHPGDRSSAPHRASGLSPMPVVDVFPVVIGLYADAGLADLNVEVQAGRLTELLAPFGGHHRPWRHPVRSRGADAVQHRLREWSHPPATVAGATGLQDRQQVRRLAGPRCCTGPGMDGRTASARRWLMRKALP